ncbi:hypothetical protein BC828DRAFT_135048 [Blastocladiella britannica]|nr:hypothetical protein BC828DRAFT_135048 [Blastocladiella britannica]
MTHRPIKIETTTRQNDLNPIWEETFTHALPKSATPHEPLSFRCAVWDSNKVQSDLMIGQFEFNLFDLVFERFHKNRAVKDSRSGWVYVSQDVTLTLTLEQAAIVANEKARRTRQATTGSAANSTGVLAQNDMPFGGGQPKPLAQPTLRVHVAVLLPPGYIDESQLPVHRPFPPGMESMLDDDDPWREEVIFPNALVHAANAAGKAPMAGSPVTPLTAEHRPTSMSHTGLDMLSPDNAAGRSRANSLAMETASIASSMKKKPFSGLRKVFKRNKEKGAAPEMDESLEEMRTSMSE